MRKIYLLQLAMVLLLLSQNFSINAQGGVAINIAGSAPDSSALFDLSSVNKGFLMPRMSMAQRNAIVKPATGLFIFNTDCNVVNFNAGTPASPNWATLNSSNAPVAGVNIAANPVGAVCAGTSVTFTATPNQINPTYQWQVNGANVGTNNATYTTSALNNADVVTCIMTTTANCVVGSPATSNPITMLINSVPTITQIYPDSFCSGNPVTLSATASSGNINWFSAPTGGSSLATSGSFIVTGLSDTTIYYVDATFNNCTTANRTAVTATYYPNTPPQPGTISGPITSNVNATETYSIAPVAYAGSYFWTVTLGTIVSGQGTNSINVTWDTFGFGRISVVANNACGTSPEQALLPIGLGTGTQSFSYSGGQQTYTVPNGVSQIAFAVLGAQGGTSGANNGGLGGYSTGSLTVTPGQLFYIYIGGQPGSNTGGFNGGGNGIGGTGGGGGTDVRFNGNGLGNRIIIAGGGGGVSNSWTVTGGTGGGTTGGNGISSNGPTYNGSGGTQGAGGSGETTYHSGTAGSYAQGGNAGTANNSGGGGGGGYYGGGGGDAGGGGGGSGYTGGVNNGNMQNGIQPGNGEVIIIW